MKSGASAQWKYYLLLFIANILLSSCNLFNTDDKNLTIIKGNISLPVSNKVYYYSYANPADKYLEIKTALDSASLDENGNYSLTIKSGKTGFFDLKNGDSTLVNNLFLLPGDKLTIDFNEPQRIPEIRHNNEAAFRNRFILSYIDTFYKKPATKHIYYIVSNYLSPDEYTSYSEDRRQKQIAFYKDYFKDEKMNKDFDDVMFSEVSYQSAVDKLMYAWKKRMKGENSMVTPSYYSFISPELLENPKAISSPSYIRFLNLYIKDVFERKIENGELPINKSEKLIPSVEKYKLAEHELKKPFSDIVIYNIIHDDMSYSGEKLLLSNFSETPIDSLINWFHLKYPSSFTDHSD